jgi:hypothetical protein
MGNDVERGIIWLRWLDRVVALCHDGVKWRLHRERRYKRNQINKFPRSAGK